MSIINLKTDWHSLLSPTTTVPPDVTFLVEDELEEGGQGGVLSKIGAHRVLLAGVSFQRDVLRPHEGDGRGDQGGGDNF